MPEQSLPLPIEKPVHILEMRDLFFAAINGLFIGIFAPFIFRNLGAALPVSHVLFAFILAIVCVLGIAVGYFLSKISPRLGFFFQLAKFGLIGVANFVVDLGIFSLFIWMTHISTGSTIVLFKIVSVSVAIINSYIWNKFWSFEEKRTDEETLRRQFFQFIGISVVGLILNTAITYSLITFAGNLTSHSSATWATISSAIASVVVLSWNFVGYKFFVFKR
jgi:putative flippase GtrA